MTHQNLVTKMHFNLIAQLRKLHVNHTNWCLCTDCAAGLFTFLLTWGTFVGKLILLQTHAYNEMFSEMVFT